MNIIQLLGCGIEPLGAYLKALGVLRLVSEQGEPTARGYWNRDSFCLETELDEEALLQFFLERYSPTPILSPWNGGSGFYPKDSKVGIDAIANSSAERFSVYREGIRLAKENRCVGDE
jgi:CRISPR-associated protein Csx17